jgi:hypothetical protein
MAYALIFTAMNQTGSGTARAMYWSDKGYVHIDCSGNSASATLWASPDGNGKWMSVTSWALGQNVTATAQVASFLPYVNASLDWVSAGTGGNSPTAKVSFYFAGRLQGV